MPTIQFTVLDVTTSLPVERASLRVSAINRYLELTTDASGLAEYTGDGICIDLVTVRVQADGYQEDVLTLQASGFGTTQTHTLYVYPGSGWRTPFPFSPYDPATNAPYPLQAYFAGIVGTTAPAATGRSSGGTSWDVDIRFTGLLSGEVIEYSSRNLPAGSGPGVALEVQLHYEPYQVAVTVYRGAFPVLSPPAQVWKTWADPGIPFHGDPLYILATFDPAYLPPPPPEPRGPGEGPCNLVSCFGRYLEALASGGRILVQRAVGMIPPWEVIASASSGPNDRDPDMDQEPEGRLWLVFTQAAGELRRIQRCYSDDAGETWSTPEMAFDPGSHSVVKVERASRIRVEAAYRAGKIVGREFNAGGASAEFTFQVEDGGALVDLEIEEDGFDIVPANDEARRWMLVATPLGSGGTSTWVSTDVCRTWKEV